MDPKQRTTRFLESKHVTGYWHEKHAGDIVFEIIHTHMVGMRVEIYNAAQLPNPVVTTKFPPGGLTLRKALEDVCSVCDMVVEVRDDGVVVLRAESLTEQLERALHVNAVARRVRQPTVD